MDTVMDDEPDCGLVFKQMESFSVKLPEAYVSPREEATDPRILCCEQS
jgi:hypothetical protein